MEVGQLKSALACVTDSNFTRTCLRVPANFTEFFLFFQCVALCFRALASFLMAN